DVVETVAVEVGGGDVEAGRDDAIVEREVFDLGQRVGAIRARHDEAVTTVGERIGRPRAGEDGRIVALTAIQNVIPGAAGELVGRGVADDQIVAAAADYVVDVADLVGADFRSRCLVLCGGQVDDDAERRRRIDDGVDAVAAVIGVVAGARAADNGIVADAREDKIVARTTDQRIVAAATLDTVAAVPSVDDIVLTITDEAIAKLSSAEISKAVHRLRYSVRRVTRASLCGVYPRRVRKWVERSDKLNRFVYQV